MRSADYEHLAQQAGLDIADVDRVVSTALEEDLRYGPDITTLATTLPSSKARARLATRQHGVIAGIPLAMAVLEAVGGNFEIDIARDDRACVVPGETVLEIDGAVRGLLIAERTLLNLVTHLCGIATLTRTWVDALSGSRTKVRDTRKTTPGLRTLEKYAVRCGGGHNHRLGLGDAALIKDNHIAAAGGVTAAIRAVRSHSPDIPLEVECDTTAQVREALDAGVTSILLDNMSLDETHAAVEIARTAPGVELEASGGINLEQARRIAESGIDYIAAGALTHSAPAIDIGLDIQ